MENKPYINNTKFNLIIISPAIFTIMLVILLYDSDYHNSRQNALMEIINKKEECLSIQNLKNSLSERILKNIKNTDSLDFIADYYIEKRDSIRSAHQKKYNKK